MKINFITGNQKKVAIAQAAFGQEFQIISKDLDIPELQSMSLKEIALVRLPL